MSSKLNKLYLWTERGALLHAKSLNTDKAWEVYDRLVETYFRVRALGEAIKVTDKTERLRIMELNARTRKAKLLYQMTHGILLKPAKFIVDTLCRLNIKIYSSPRPLR
ncbi:MAG: hypothetical protein LBK41_00865 [Clostridiales bacterium]|nr:hypothetical protein [Clostridiales bacterium]